MNYTMFGKNDSIVYIESEDVLITDTQSALDLIATVSYEKDSNRIILDKKAINEEFFRLSSGIAGDVLQKFINYHTKLAIIGDFSKYTSKSLHDFIYECNKGKDIFFVESLEQAVEKLS
ncbi:MAG: cytoplasmic protein [Sedimentibacter sp.]|nr:cytoplasmic protein [Sedimentibacter sp.]